MRTGQVPSLWHAGERLGRVLRWIELGKERAALDRDQRVHRHERVAHHLVPRSPGVRPARRVLDGDTRARQVRRARGPSPSSRRRCPTPAHGRAPLGQRCRTRPKASSMSCRRAARTGTTVARRGGTPRSAGHRSRARPLRPTAPIWRRRPRARPTGAKPLAGAGVLFEPPVLDLQASNPHVQSRRVARIDHGLGARR